MTDTCDPPHALSLLLPAPAPAPASIDAEKSAAGQRVSRSVARIDRRAARRENSEQESEIRGGAGVKGRRRRSAPDLFMNAEIPRGSPGVPKHQRDCVPSRRYSITGLSEYPHPRVPLCSLNCRTSSASTVRPSMFARARAHARHRTSTCKRASVTFARNKDVHYARVPR